MAFTPFTGTYSSGDLQYVINEIYSPKVEREYRSNLVAADFFNDLSGMFAGGGGNLSIPDIFTNQFSANTKSTGSDVTEQSPSQAQLTLSVDTWKEVSYLIEDRQLSQIMTGSDVLDAYSQQAKHLIAKALDSSLMSLYSGLSQTVNDTASDVTDVDIRKAIEGIVDGDVPMQNLAFFFHPTVIWHDLFGISKYTGVYDSEGVATGMLGGATQGRKNAFRGMLYGIPVYETTQVQEDAASSAYYNLLASPDAFMFATQIGPRSQANYVPEQLGTLWTTDVFYGVAEKRDAAGVSIKSRQTGVVS